MPKNYKISKTNYCFCEHPRLYYMQVSIEGLTVEFMQKEFINFIVTFEATFMLLLTYSFTPLQTGDRYCKIVPVPTFE